MRVRTGKIIKTKNISPVIDSFSITASDLTILSGCGGQWIASDYKSTLFSAMHSRIGHTIFMIYFLESFSLPALNTVMRLICVRANGSSVLGQSASVYKDDNKYYASMEVTEGTSANPETADTWLQLNSGNYFAAGTTYKFVIVDLTETFGSGKEPTAQQFYNKYKDKLELLATGEEITIDNKTGKIPLGSKLSSQYREVEYIEGTGTQYIEINFSPTANTKVVYKMKASSSQTVASAPLLGTRVGSGNTNRFFPLAYSGTTNGRMTFGNKEHVFTLNTDTIYEGIFDAKNQTAKLNGQTYSLASNSFAASTATKFCVFGTNGYGTNHYIAKGRCYFCKIYENEILVKDLIPCYRVSDGVIGLFDAVNKDFYTNTGTGTFSKGNNVNNYISCNPAVKMYGYNQQVSLLDKPGANWGTVSVDDDGIITYTATGQGNSAAVYRQLYPNGATANHKYYMRAKIKSSFNTTDTCFVFDGKYTGTFRYQLVANEWTQMENIITDTTPSTSSGVAGFNYIYIQMSNPLASVGSTVQVKEWNFVDLTDWYGPGKEPTTVQEFKEKFNKDYYGFCKNKIRLTERQINALPVYGYNQAIQNGDFSDNTNWAACSDSTLVMNDKVATVTKNSSSTANYSFGLRQNFKVQFTSGHKVMLLCEIMCSRAGDISFDTNNTITGISAKTLVANQWTEWGAIGTGTGNQQNLWVYARTTSNYQQGDIIKVKNFNVIDLTDWYGAGSEPSTVAEFKATFPHKYYQYMKKSLLNRYMINALGIN